MPSPEAFSAPRGFAAAKVVCLLVATVGMGACPIEETPDAGVDAGIGDDGGISTDAGSPRDGGIGDDGGSDVDSGVDVDGGGCIPVTCAEAGAECGDLDDGCGATIVCGECSGLSICGEVVANRCDIVCHDDCPAGYSCSDADGVCAGGDPSGLVVNFRYGGRSSATFQLQVNGQPLSASSLQATETSLRLAGDENTPFEYVFLVVDADGVERTEAVDVADGRYHIEFLTPSSQSPWTEWSPPDIEVSGDRVVILDLPQPETVTISGTLQTDGGVVVSNPDVATPCVDVRFVSHTGWNSTTVNVCEADAWAFEVELIADTYDVDVRGGGDIGAYDGSLLVGTYPLLVDTAETFDIPAPPLANVTGVVQVNGAPPVPSGIPASRDGCVRVVFTHATWTSPLRAAIQFSETTCSETGWAFDFQLPTGDYALRIERDLNTVLMPASVEVGTKTISADGTMTVDLIVPDRVPLVGGVTFSGIAPVPVDATGRFRLTFVPDDEADHTARGLPSRSILVDAQTGYRFVSSDDIYPGRYRVRLDPTWTVLMPQRAFEIEPVVISDSGEVALDFPIAPPVTLSGTLSANGALFEVEAGSDMACLTVVFSPVIEDAEITPVRSLVCSSGNAWTYEQQLSPGEYDVSVLTSDVEAPLGLLFIDTVAFSADITFDIDLVFEPQVDVAGTVQVNGLTPATLGAQACLTFQIVGYAYGARVPFLVCEADDWAFAGQVYGGVHRIEGTMSNNPNIYVPGWPTSPFEVVRRIGFE